MCASSGRAQLTAADVQLIIKQAATRAQAVSPNSIIAVVDREGFVLGVWSVNGTQPSDPQVASAVSKAGTAAFLSSDQNAFTTRTAGFIIQQHFPPGVFNTPTGPLVGVGLSSLSFSDINKFKAPGSLITFSPTPGLTIISVPLTSLDGTPGGVPLYKGGHLVGGVGVTGDGTPGPIVGFRSENPFVFISGADVDEGVALAGETGYRPSSDITADNVFINGISLAYTDTDIPSLGTLSLPGAVSTKYPIMAAPAPYPYPVATLGGVLGQVRQPIISDPMPGTINSQPRLTAAEVTQILAAAADRVRTTRAGIRLPIGIQMEAFISVVNFPNQDGMRPTVLGTFRTGEATIFSWDVAVQKARTAIAFSNNNNTIAMSARTVGFLAQSHFAPGIDANHAGPYFGQQEAVSGLLGTLQNVVPNLTFTPDPNLPNGITIFPGGFPLYRNGQLIGAIGVSGDGVDQDDLVAASGTVNFPTPLQIGADEFVLEGTRLPYAKFPRDPTGTLGALDTTILASPHAITLSEGLVNISTRMKVGTGESQAIAGFIISGNAAKTLVLRALGPSLAQFGLGGVLANPALEIHDHTGALVASNQDWQSTQMSAITETGLAPENEAEAALKITLPPGTYTAVMSGENGGTGVGLVEVYDLSTSSDSKLANISTRGFVAPNDDAMIGGFIVGGESGCSKIVTRALGPSLATLGVSGALADPNLELRDADGAVVMANDNWGETQAPDLETEALAPSDPREAATLSWLPVGPYTVVVQGTAGASGVGLIEVYAVQ
ncbi:MAG: heme-binding protein [Chthoniobacterales bacterium]|nr:heme-binding protein [Chthoniobacterales bacterium]